MFILMGFDNDTRSFTVERFQTKQAAWEGMLNNLLSVHNREFVDSYKDFSDRHGFVKGLTEFGISESSAWANCGNGMNCDWSIYEIADEADSSSDKVTTICYGKKETWKTRKEAEDFFLDCMADSEGSECMRYVKIYTALKAGQSVCADE